MKTSCHSEYGQLKRVLVKRPQQAFINPERINAQWKELNFLAAPDLKLAEAQFKQFESLLTLRGATLEYLPQDDSVTLDSMYCRDAAIATDRGMILCSMGKPARKPEPLAERKALESAAIPILGVIELPGTLEGGDVAWLDEKNLAVGHTYRTNWEGIRQLKHWVEPMGVHVWVAEMPHYKGPADVFHLMSVYSPVDKNLAVVYSPLMPISFRKGLLEHGIEFVEVPDEEWESMGCNVLAIAPREVIIVKGNPVTRQRLEAAGCQVHEYEGSEISLKGGGGPTCLTRPIERLI